MDFKTYLGRRKRDLFDSPPTRANLLDLLEAKYKAPGSGGTLRPGEVLVEAESMEEAFRQAAEQLGTDISKLSYRVVEQGGGGIFGVGKKKFQIAFSEYGSSGSGGRQMASRDIDFGDIGAVPANRDGYAELQVTKGGKFLVVFPPLGEGTPISEEAVNNLLKEKGVVDADLSMVRALVKKKDGRPFKLGEWVPNFKNDGKVYFEMSDDRMKGFVRIIPPKADGRYIDEEDVRNILAENRVTDGVDNAKIKNAIDKKIFNIPVLVAVGREVKHGKDASIDYKVEFREKEAPLTMSEDEDVDFHEMNLIVNVMVDEILAEKIPATKGETGVNILGQPVVARDGKDVELKGGENTILTPDGMALKAGANGHAILAGGLINVKPVFEITGDVGPATGNITNMGSVVVMGNVLDGYNVKAAGNIEVKRSVGNCLIEATGDITIKLGVNGKNSGKIISQSGSLHAKFLQDVQVKVANDVIVNESIIHSQVDSAGRVILMGKKAGIVGGKIRALSEVKARTIGSPGNVKTVIEVGVPPEIREGLETIAARITETEPQITTLKLDITTLKQQRLDEEKEKILKETEEKYNVLLAQLQEDKAHLGQLQEILAQSPVNGKVTFTKTLYTGVVLSCNTGNLENKRDQSSPSEITVDENNREYVKFTPYKVTRGSHTR